MKEKIIYEPFQFNLSLDQPLVARRLESKAQTDSDGRIVSSAYGLRNSGKINFCAIFWLSSKEVVFTYTHSCPLGETGGLF